MLELILFVVETIKYGVLYWVLFSKRITRIWIAVALGTCLGLAVIVLCPELSVEEKRILAYLGTLLAMGLMMGGNWKQRGAELFVMFLIMSILTRVCRVPIRLYELYVGTKMSHFPEGTDSFIVGLITLAVFLIIGFCKKRCKGKWNNMNRKGIYFLVLFMVIEMLVTVTLLNFVGDYTDNRRFAAFAMILGATSYVAIGILGVFVVYIRNQNAKNEEMLQSELHLKEMQKKYYEALLEKEEETRRYRHDMANHLICLDDFVQKEDLKKVKEYLNEIHQQVSRIQQKCYETGNEVLNALTNYYLSSVDETVDVRVVSRLKEPLMIDNMALCTLYGNLVQNAVEELARIENGKKLSIELYSGKQFFQLKIENSVSKKSLEKEQILMTGKGDKKNHGIGLKNVERVVKENGGELEITCGGDLFAVYVSLENKSNRSRT